MKKIWRLPRKFLVPMAVSLGFGIVFATAVTLVLVPSLYKILDDAQGVVAGWTRSEEEHDEPGEALASPAP